MKQLSTVTARCANLHNVKLATHKLVLCRIVVSISSASLVDQFQFLAEEDSL